MWVVEVDIVLRSSTEEQRFREGPGVEGSHLGYANERGGGGLRSGRVEAPLGLWPEAQPTCPGG